MEVYPLAGISFQTERSKVRVTRPVVHDVRAVFCTTLLCFALFLKNIFLCACGCVHYKLAQYALGDQL